MLSHLQWDMWSALSPWAKCEVSVGCPDVPVKRGQHH